MNTNTTQNPSVIQEAMRLRKETGKPMGWCMNEALLIVRAWALENGLVD